MDESELVQKIDKIAGAEWACPQPTHWNTLYKMLPDRTRVGHGWTPPLPLILAAWWEASPQSKKQRFIEHLKWADEHRVLDFVLLFLEGLSAEDWYRGK